jgi:uncharacterized protein YjbJ (UPF0337 family)
MVALAEQTAKDPLAKSFDSIWARYKEVACVLDLNIEDVSVEAGGAASHRSIRFKGDNKMKPSTEDEVAGKVYEVKGKIKEKVGQLTNDSDLEAEGVGEKIAGKIQNKIGQVEKVLEKS